MLLDLLHWSFERTDTHRGRLSNPCTHSWRMWPLLNFILCVKFPTNPWNSHQHSSNVAHGMVRHGGRVFRWRMNRVTIGLFVFPTVFPCRIYFPPSGRQGNIVTFNTYWITTWRSIRAIQDAVPLKLRVMQQIIA